MFWLCFLHFVFWNHYCCYNNLSSTQYLVFEKEKKEFRCGFMRLLQKYSDVAICKGGGFF